MNETVYMKIKELSHLSHVPPSTIRFYVKEGLLPEPIKTGKTIGFYSNEHLRRIEFIKKMQVEEKASISEIKKKIGKKFKKEIEEPKETPRILSSRRGDILQTAIDLFRKNGYTNTSITDIVKESKVGRDTFYQNFSSKEELFLECAEMVFFELYSDVWKEIKNEKDMRKRFQKRWETYFASFPKWIDMMNLIRGLSVQGKKPFATKLEKLMDQIIQPNINDFETAKKQGYVSKDLNSEVLGYMINGMAEYCCNMIYQKKADPKTVSDTFNSLISRLA